MEYYLYFILRVESKKGSMFFLIKKQIEHFGIHPLMYMLFLLVLKVFSVSQIQLGLLLYQPPEINREYMMFI